MPLKKRKLKAKKAKRRLRSNAGLSISNLGRAGTKKHVDARDGDRRCIVTGESQPRAGLIRFVAGPDGVVVPDVLEKLPGRGLWVSADRAALEKAVKKNPFSRAAKSKVSVPEGFAQLVETQLADRVISLVSLARRSGDAICGFEKTKSALVNESAVILAQASDGSDDQKRKLRPPRGPNTYISCLNAAELGLAFGREYVIHAALMAGGLTETIRSDAQKLAGVRRNQTKKLTPDDRSEGR